MNVDAADLACLLVLITLLIPADQIIPGVGLTPSSALSLALGFLWLSLHCGQNMPVAKGSNFVRSAVFSLVAATVLAFINGMYGFLTPEEAKNSTNSLILFIATVGLCLFLVDVVFGDLAVSHVARCFVLTTSLVALVGIIESIVGQNFAVQLSVPGLQSTSFAGLTQAPRDSLVRAQSTAGHPIEFGVLCVMAVPFAVHFAARHGEARWRMLYWLCALTLCMGGVFSISRSAIVALVVGALVLLARASRRQRMRGALVGILAVVALWVLAPRVLSVLTSFFASASSDPSISSRTADYAAVSDEVARSPVLGHGYGTWFAPIHQIFDNEYLLTLVESGLVGLLATIAVLTVAIWRSAIVDRRSYSRQSLSISCTSSLAIVAVTSATFDFSSFPVVNTMAFVIIGLTGALDRGSPRRGRNA